jgi:Ni,Fe-hydrogenase III small subunit
MFKTFIKIFNIGIVTQKLPLQKGTELDNIRRASKKIIASKFNGSLNIRHVDAGSCNACELEIHALNNPFYDLERFGIHFVASPRHADLLLVTGPVTKHMETALIDTYNAMPKQKLVIASGDCAISGGEFGCNYACVGQVDKIIPVDLKIKGCPPTPLALLQGILELLNSF